MSLIKCRRCGEMFSDSYKTCPFCEEDDAYYGGRVRKRRNYSRDSGYYDSKHYLPVRRALFGGLKI